jgi:hypothetical protein
VITADYIYPASQISVLGSAWETPEDQMEKKNTVRQDLTPEEREKAERIGRIDFKSAGATRKR